MTDARGTTIGERIRQYLVQQLQGDATVALQPDTPLVTGGILDSLAVLDLVAFLESTFDIEFEAHEVTRDRLDTLTEIEALVQAKLDRRS